MTPEDLAFDLAAVEARMTHALRIVADVCDDPVITAALADLPILVKRERDRGAVLKERDELRATIDNERGEGAGPSDGWTCEPGGRFWRHDHASAHVVNQHTGGWAWFIYDSEGDERDDGIAETARQAMRAADAARGAP